MMLSPNPLGAAADPDSEVHHEQISCLSLKENPQVIRVGQIGGIEKVECSVAKRVLNFRAK